MQFNVIKRNRTLQEVDFNKIKIRIEGLCSIDGLPILDVDKITITKETINKLYPGISTSELDTLAAMICSDYQSINPAYGLLGGRIIISNLMKNLKLKNLNTFTDKILYLNNNLSNFYDEKFIECIKNNKDYIDSLVDYNRNYIFDYFGFKTLEASSYLHRAKYNIIDNDKKKVIYETIETPQDMWMRVAVFINMDDLNKIKVTYDHLSQKEYIHATPTLFNAGIKYPQLSSCYLYFTGDSVEEIYKTLSDSALISKWSGGIGFSISSVRGKGSVVNSTNGEASGIVKMIKIFNESVSFVSQGGGKRPGSMALYIEMWHSDIMEFLELKLPIGAEDQRARKLFFALWIDDLFMKTVEENGDWYLMSPDECPGLYNVYGEDFNNLYNKYIQEGKYRTKLPASKIWEKILVSNIETGIPYMLSKDNVNKTSYHSNIGVVKNSNLCVAPETRILTDQGYQVIKDLENQKIKVWNGEEFSKTTVIKTGVNQELIKVSFSNGEYLECTPYHKFYIKDNDIIEAQDLIIGMNITPFKLPKSYLIDDIKISKIEDLGRKDDTFCFNEPLKNSGVFNGILTSQCSEITIYSDKDSYGVCNLASIGLPKFITNNIFDFNKLIDVASDICEALNNVIDKNFYPVPEAAKNNKSLRPIGIGIQGVNDCIYMLDMIYESDEALAFEAKIMECIYYGAVRKSIELAKLYGPYDRYEGSKYEEGILNFDMYDNVTLTLDWTTIRENLKKHGIRNSLLIALMPTASTSQIFGFTECFEPVTSNIYTRTTSAGSFLVINQYLIDDLNKLNLWNDKLRNQLISYRGSVQQLDIPQKLKDKYKTVWEIKQRWLINHSIARQPFVDQSQSLNLYFEDPSYAKLTSALFHGWKKGLKCLKYYLRTQPAMNPQQFTQESVAIDEKTFCSLASPEACIMCSS